MAKNINIQKLLAVLKDYGCEYSKWKDLKSGDDVIIAASKACLKSSSSESRLRIKRVRII